MVRFNAPDFVWSPNAADRSADDKGPLVRAKRIDFDRAPNWALLTGPSTKSVLVSADIGAMLVEATIASLRILIINSTNEVGHTVPFCGSTQDTGQDTGQDTEQVAEHVAELIQRLVLVIHGEIDRQKLLEILQLKQRENFMQNYIYRTQQPIT